jgi:hypothetical protein
LPGFEVALGFSAQVPHRRTVVELDPLNSPFRYVAQKSMADIVDERG